MLVREEKQTKKATVG